MTQLQIAPFRTVPLREVAHSRSGEKGNDNTISIIAYDEADYDILLAQVTVPAVEALFGALVQGDVLRYEVPRIAALNFVLKDSMGGGRSRTLAFEESGKTLSALMLSIDVQVPPAYVTRFEKGVNTL